MKLSPEEIKEIRERIAERENIFPLGGELSLQEWNAIHFFIDEYFRSNEETNATADKFVRFVRNLNKGEQE